MQPASQDARASKPQPFGEQNNLNTTSFGSSVASECSHGGTSSGQSACCSCANCSPLVGCSSLQLQEQHLLGGNQHCTSGNTTSSCAGSQGACRNPQDMLVLVIPQHADKATADAAGHGPEAAKACRTLSGRSVGPSVSGTSVMTQACNCHQNPRQLTQELCLRFVALLLVVLAVVGLAYRLARRDS